MVIREPHPLRDYQIAAVAEAERRNIICVLPTNSGKTVIAAALIERMLRRENSECGLARKMLFVVTTRELAVQQARVLLEQIPMLKTDEKLTADDNAAWRLGLLIGLGSDEADTGTRSPTFFQHTQVCVVIEAKLEDALVHGYLQMEDVALLVMDEAHHARGNSIYATIAKYFYAPCERRPRVLALTASPVEAAAGTKTCEEEFLGKLEALEKDLNAAAWGRVVDREHCPNAEPSVLEHAPKEKGYLVRTNDETACFAYRALCDAKPTLAEATERGLSHKESTEFLEAWDKCVERAVKVSEPFGAWALDWCARMLENDLSRGARRLSWYDKPMDEEDEQQKFVGGTDAHAYLLSAAQTKLKQQLRTRAKALPEAAVGGKLHTLIEYLVTRAPRKCLIFVQQRVSCSLLVDAIKALLGQSVGWSAHRIDWICRPGKVGVSPSGPGSSTYSEGQLGQALGAFRADLRMLVSTSILEEGIDVPECDAVIDFDGATSTRQGQQRKGRARAKNASYAYLVASDEAEKLRQDYENVRRMNEMTVEMIARRAERPSPQMLSAEEARTRIALECVRTEGSDGRACALLPIERCKALLDHVYYVQKFHVQPGAPGFELDLSADGTHFTAKEKGANNFQVTPIKQPTGTTLFSCALHLPGVLLCSAEVGEQLPITLPLTDSYRAKKDAVVHAALEGVKYLRSIGVLDAHLQVVGRAAALHQLREAVGAGKRRSSTRANKYAQHVKEAYVRELPTLFRTIPSVDAAGKLSVWCHPLTIGGTATGLAVLFSGKCPVRELLVGSEKQRQQCVLEDGFPMTLSTAQAQLAAKWLVGSLDLTQAGNSGEPLHPSLNAPQQLLRWHHLIGNFSPNLVAELPVTREVAGLDSFPRTKAWRDHRRAFPDEARAAAVSKLAADITSIVSSIGQRMRAASGDMPLSPYVIVTVDLDRTLWKGECLDWPVGSFKSHSATAVFDDQAERFLELHAEVPLVFAALKQAGVRVAVASASIAADSARALLASFGLREHVSDDSIEMGDDEYKRDSRKVAHLQSLSERLGVPVDRFLLFDDSQANVDKVREVLGPADAEAGCSATCVDPAVGLTAEALLLGLEHRLAELTLRKRFSEERCREESRGDAHKERLRKVKQSHADTLAQGQAHLDDQYRVASKLEKLAVEPGWWLAVPLTPDSVESAAQLDLDLMEHAARLFTTCEWPSLTDAAHDRLVQANATVHDDVLRAGPVDLCALATYAAERHLHYNLLLRVSAEGDGDSMTISGDVRSRQVHNGASAAKRIVQADGSFRTQATERAVGYRPQNVQLLPMRSSHHDALKVLKRLLCRLEHLVRLTEPDVGALFGADAVAVPLERLSGALTHPGASAEAVRVNSLPPAQLDRFMHDEHGCCQWEELEWLGDGILRFYAVMWVLVNDQGTSVKGLSPAKEAIESNHELHRRAKQRGLPVLLLCNPFATSATLPQLRKQACSIKDQADPIEALLGTVALAAIDAEPGEPALPTAIRGAYGFFHSVVLPTPQQATLSTLPFDTAAKLMAELVTQFTRCHKDVENDEAAAGLRAALVAQSGHIPLERVDGMVHACSICRSGIVFERAEFFGDAFLQIAVSIELARRFPHLDKGDFSDTRSALVNNLHLGRLLIRRFGVDQTHRFVEESGSGVANKPNQLKAIRTFISETASAAHADEPLDTVWAIRAASKAEEEGSKAKVRAQVLAAANGLEEADEPTVGSSSDSNGEAQYYSKRGEDYRKPLGDQYEAIVGLVFCAYGGDCDATWRCFVNDFFPPSSPSCSAPEQAGTQADEEVADEGQCGKMNKALHDLRQTKAELNVKRQRRWAASSALPVAPAAPVPSAAVAQQYDNPIGEVNERLQRAQVERELFLRSEFSERAPFRFELFHVDSSQLLGSAAGHARKKAAEKAAYIDMLNCWEQRGIHQLLDRMRTGGMQPTLQPMEEVPPPASQPLVEHVEQLRLAGSKRALGADI